MNQILPHILPLISTKEEAAANVFLQVYVLLLFFPDNYYGTPKPPAEPAPLLLNVTDQILPGATPGAEGKRKRNKSVSNMEKTGIEPPEEEEEERPVVNGNDVTVTPGLFFPTLQCISVIHSPQLPPSTVRTYMFR